MRVRNLVLGVNPFAILGISPQLDLDPKELERRYLHLVRQAHPDHARAETDGEVVTVLSRSAALNDAYKIVRDPWSRARALVEYLEPGALDAEKKLSPTFLAQAMELAEEVAHARGDGARHLHDRLVGELASAFDRLRAAFAAGKAREAARLVHEGRYFQKALADLEEHA